MREVTEFVVDLDGKDLATKLKQLAKKVEELKKGKISFSVEPFYEPDGRKTLNLIKIV